MEAWFKKGFNNLKQEIIRNSNQIKHLIKLDNEIIFVSGQHHIIDSNEYLFVKYMHPAVRKSIAMYPDIFYGENYIFETQQKEYIIKIEDKKKYKFSNPLLLCVDSEYNNIQNYKEIEHTGYYGCGKTIGLNFNEPGGMIGFLPDQYIPMLNNKIYRTESRGGRWNKLFGYTEYTIKGDMEIKEFLINKVKEREN